MVAEHPPGVRALTHTSGASVVDSHRVNWVTPALLTA